MSRSRFAPLLTALSTDTSLFRRDLEEQFASFHERFPDAVPAHMQETFLGQCERTLFGWLSTHSGFSLLPDPGLTRTDAFLFWKCWSERLVGKGAPPSVFLEGTKACRRAFAAAAAGASLPLDVMASALLAVERFFDAVECGLLPAWEEASLSGTSAEADGGDLHVLQARLAAAETQLAQAQKMEAIGRLTGGIAHDFNNLLTGILGYASLLKASLPGGSEECEAAEYIERAAKRASDLTRQLLAYSRREAAVLKPLCINRIIAEAVEILSRSANKDVRIRTELLASRTMVLGDNIGLVQLLLNLGVNANDAMPEGGILTIATGNHISGGDRSFRDVPIPAGDYLTIRVSDTGAGIPPEIRDRIFEPFFTTKEQGKGTGLGLSMVYNCVKSHRGFIVLQSEEGEGASFLILLPLAAVAEDRGDQPSLAARVPRGTETILVIDDEEIPLRLACDMLRTLGYTALSASSGAKGLEILKAERKAIGAAVLDKIMPGMDGSETLRRIRRVDPSLPVILTSGYIDDMKENPDLIRQFDDFLPKPYKLEELARKLRQVLDAPRR